MKDFDIESLESVLEDIEERLPVNESDVKDRVDLADRSHSIPLSWSQQRLWFLEQLEDLGSAYHIEGALRLEGELDEAALQASLDAIVARHEALRTVFVRSDDEAEPHQVIQAAAGFVLARKDLSMLPEQQREGELQAELERAAAQRFDLSQGPLIRGELIRLSGREHVLFVSMHHIVSDGWSMGVLTQELSALYAASLRGEQELALVLPALPIQYVDYAQWQRQWLTGERLAKQLSYWKERLTGAPSLLELPTDHTRPAVKGYAGSMVSFELSPELSQGLHALGRRHGATLFMVLQAAWAVLLGRLSGQDDIVIGTPVANRRRSELEGLIGFFVNTLALRTRIDPKQTVGELLGQVREETLEAFNHQDTPFEQVVEVVQPERSLSHGPLFQVMLVLQNAPQTAFELSGLKLSMQEQERHAAQFDLSLSLQEGEDGGLSGALEYSAELFERETVQRWLGHFRVLLSAMVAGDESRLSELPLLTEAEKAQIVKGFNATQAPYPKEALIHELFEQQVEKTPDAVAVQYEGERLTYAELNAKANQLAHRLRSLTDDDGQPVVKPDALVAISVERSLEMVVGLLGILKAGAAYVPVDPEYPADRIEYMLGDSQARVLVTQKVLLERLPASVQATETVVLLDDDETYAGQPVGDIAKEETGQSSRNLAYVIYTSGSTGLPKGVMNEHQGVVNRLWWMQQEYQLGDEDRVLQKTPFSFDVSVWEFFWTLQTGARLVMARPGGHQDPAYLGQAIETNGITTLHFVPSMLQVFLSHLKKGQCRSVRRMVCSGEELPLSLQRQCLEKLPGSTLNNLYGPTEAAVDVTYWQCDPAQEQGRVPIGRPISNIRMYVLDGEDNPVPVGVAGEICIGGDGVARGYLNRPELTAERFVADPFSEEPGARMYRTGDLGRWREDGAIEYLGRNDFQVKIRGLRIELGEIEARLAELPAVREVVVLAREDQPGDKRLVAYWTTLAGLAEAEVPTVEELRDHLKAELPAYMVPSAFVRLEEMPLTPNGKVDRKALPAPEADALITHAYEAPQGETEAALAAIWQELLGVERVGRHDNFFDLGGHSLLAVQLLARVRHDLGQEVALRTLFEAPSVAEIAGKLQASDVALLAPIEHADRAGELKLSWSQQRLWFLEQLEDLGSAYHIEGALRLEGELDEAALQASLDAIVARHEALRTVFVRSDDEAEPHQVIQAAAGFVLARKDLSMLPEQQREGELQAELERAAAQRFDLSQGPLIRGELIRLSGREHVLFVSMHHIVSDGWSMGVLTQELSALYAASLRGEQELALVLPALPIQYVDYAQWQRQWLTGERLAKQLSYWKERLTGAPSLLELPTDHTRPAVKGYAGSMVSFELSPELSQGLHALGRRHGATLFMVLQAAWAVLLGRLSGQDDIVIGTPVANRRRSELEGLIGFFVNTLALRTRIDPKQTVGELLGQVREETLEAFNHQDTPFEQVVEVVQPERSLSHGPLFQVMLVLQNAPQTAFELSGLKLSMQEQERHAAQFDLSLSLQEGEDGGLSGALEYSAELFERETVQRWLGHFRVLLSAMVAGDESRLSELPLLTEAEKAQIVKGFNATQAPYPKEALIHELFEQQVEKTPDAVAVQYEGERLTYAELNAKANQLAHRLRSLTDDDGQPVVKPDALVAISVERSLEMVVGLLGILKAGAAYVPVDPEYPADRIEYMLGDSQARVLVTQKVLLERLPASVQATETVVLLDDDETYAGQPVGNISKGETGQTSRNLAYVIYTSGSTGNPKGVMVGHQGLVNFTMDMKNRLNCQPTDRMLGLTTISFDIAGLELYMPLASGAAIVLSARESALDPERLSRDLASQSITIMQATPVTWRMLLESGWIAKAGLRALSGGEALDKELAKRLCKDVDTLWNVYGPTETTIWSTVSCMRKGEEVETSAAPIGAPISNTWIYILDAEGVPVPVGVPGEIYIGGDGVVRGYLNRPELTAERFVADPFSEEPGARMYRTGDLGRWREDGAIEYLGRNDFQVKIRGLRIELGEIEARLAELPAVREVVVLAREDQPGDKRLVAYWTTLAGLAEAEVPTVEELRDHLKAELPAYMVPSAFVRLEEMPLTPNGKVDRKALPAPEADALITHAYEAPQGETEAALAAIWQELLGVERVGRHDNFFDLGGHSLLAVQLLARVRHDLGQEVALRTLFEAPSVAEIAGKLQASDVALLAPIEHADRAGELKLSWSQQRLWFLEQLEDLGSAYHIEGALRLEGELDEAALQASLDAIVARHEALRTVFVRSDDEAEPHQVIQAAAGFVLARKDLSMLPEQQREGELQAELERAAAQRFDLSQGPLIRGELIRLSGREHVLFVSMHHIVSDGWSMGVLTQELSALYAASLRGEQELALVLPALPIQYVDYAQWQRQWLTGERLAKQLSYWKERLTGAPSLLELPTDHTRPAVKGYAGSMVSFELSPELSQGLHALGRRHGATLFMVLQAAWAVLLGRLSGQDDIVIGTPVANRRRSELEGLIGFFVNTLALRTRIDPKQTVGELLGQVREETLEAFNHQDTPFEQVVEVVQPERSLSHGPLFQVMLVLQNAPQTAFELSGLKLSMQEQERHAAQFDLSLSLQEGEDGGLSGALEYSAELFERETVQRWLGHFRVLLSAMVAGDESRLSELPLLTEAEKAQIVKGFNATQAPYPKEALIHELFEQQVEKTPDAVAVQYEGERLTYAELNAKANQLAHRLRSLTDDDGQPVVKPDALVAISVERSLEMVVGLLGILKAGAAYVPVDPEYPADRIEYMLGDSQARVLVTQKVLLERLPASVQATETVVLLDDDETYAGQPVGDIAKEETGQSSRNLAYVIYTSGSTGLPKGVMNEHQGVVNRLWWMQQEYQLGDEDRVLQKTPFSFDVSVWEFFWTLQTGARLVMARPGGHQDPAYLGQAIETNGITTLHFVPSMLQVFLSHLKKGQCRSVRRMVCSGEELPLSLQRQCLEKLPGSTLNNLYGPTEAAVDVTYWQCDPAQEQGRVPIGRPISNIRMYVLDGEDNPVPVGVAGEICIGGDGVARGYLNRPELTAERFVADPFSEEPGARMYRTGDLGRWREDGAIEYLGRNDFQVKIRGLRIELGEIEARLAELPAVREVVVLAREDQPGDKRLVAYWTTLAGLAEAEVPTVEELRDHLKAELPAYMVPSAFVRLEEMPLTPNGKVDRKALPAPEADALITHAYEAPQGETEAALAAIWQELLGVERVGRHDNFFDLGGHSLLAVQLVSRIRKDLDVEIYLAPIMSSPTVHDLAVLVVNERLSHVQDLELKELLGRMDSLSEEEIARLSEEYGLGD